jgi:hypothetical protein
MRSPRGPKPDIIEELNSSSGGLLTDDHYEKMIASLKKRSEEGDPHATRQMLDLYQQAAASKAMDFVLEVTPYDIPDRKLGEIIKQADAPVVMEILAGLADRLLADRFSVATCQTLVALQRLFSEEAERIYAPPKEDE